MNCIKIAIVDDKQVNRVSLSEKLVLNQKFEIAVSAHNGLYFLEKLKETPKQNLPEVVLMDIDMPGMNGIEAVNIAHEIYPEMRFIMLTVFDDEDKIFDAIKAGAIGYLLKDENADKIAYAILDCIENGGSPMSPRIARKALQMLLQADKPNLKPAASAPLSSRELDILKLLVEGQEYKSIADKLFISPNTVRTHIKNIYEKLHVFNKAQAIQIANKNKWFLLF